MHDFVRSAQRMSGSDAEIANCLPALDTCLARITARANKDQPITPPSPVQVDLHWGISCLQENMQDIRQNMRDFRSEVQSRCTDMQKRVDIHIVLVSEIHGDAIGGADRFRSRPHQALIEICYLSLRQASKGWRRSAIGKSMRHPPCRCDW